MSYIYAETGLVCVKALRFSEFSCSSNEGYGFALLFRKWWQKFAHESLLTPGF